MIPGLLSKKFDAIISDMSITEKRQRVVNFSDSYYDETGLFMCQKGKSFDFSPEGLKGKRIGVQRATTFANYIKGVYGKSVEIRDLSPALPEQAPNFPGLESSAG